MGYNANRLKAQEVLEVFDHDPADATVATKIGWVPMGLAFLARLRVLSGAIVTFKIFAATDASGSGATEVAAHANPTQADAANDRLALEVSAEQVQKALAGATHVSAEIDMGGAGDTAVVAYLVDPLVRKDGNTTDVIS